MEDNYFQASFNKRDLVVSHFLHMVRKAEKLLVTKIYVTKEPAKVEIAAIKVAKFLKFLRS